MAEINKIQFKRGTESGRTGVTPAEGEPIYVTDTKTLYIGDGSTAGGVAIPDSATLDSLQQQVDDMMALMFVLGGD